LLTEFFPPIEFNRPAGTAFCEESSVLAEADEVAADYIISLWGVLRRKFAREYWMHLSHDMPAPKRTVFGAQKIEAKLDEISRECSHWTGGIS
jgi:hypothetical protein